MTTRIPRKTKKRLLKKYRKQCLFDVNQPRLIAVIRAWPEADQMDSRLVNRFWRTHPRLRRNEAQRILRQRAKAGLPTNWALGVRLGGNLSGWRVAYPWGRPEVRERWTGLWNEQRTTLLREARYREEKERMAPVIALATKAVAAALDKGVQVAEERKAEAMLPCECGHAQQDHGAFNHSALMRGAWCVGGTPAGHRAWDNLKCACTAFVLAPAQVAS